MFKQIFTHLFCIAAILVALVLITVSCNNNFNHSYNNKITGKLVSSSHCKLPGDHVYSDNFSQSDEGMDYYYEETGTLHLTHVNAAFDMCPGKFIAEFVIDGNNIIIEICESEGWCQTTCLYDLNYRLEHINLDKYHFKIITPCTKQKTPFEFTIDFNISREGSFNIRRNSFPWRAI